MKKKITSKERATINRMHYSAKWARPFMNYFLDETDGGNFILYETVKLWVYILLFIPLHLLQALHCMWDGGLCEFELCSIVVGYHQLAWGSKSWESACEILGIDKNEI